MDDGITRRYSVAEIDDLRVAVRNKILHRNYNGSYESSGGYREIEVMKQVEEMVRTHMMAGHDAGQLRASDPPRQGKPISFLSPHAQIAERGATS